MTHFTFLIVLLSIFTISLGFQNTCHATEEILMLPAPEDVYQKKETVEFSPEIIVPLSLPMIAPVPKVYKNITIPSVLETPKPVVTKAFEDDSEDEIHAKSLKIAGFVAQCIVFLFVYTIVTMDVEQFEVIENEEIPVFRLYKAREVQACPLPSRQNIRFVKCAVESDC
ncbi:unnamed protein product [Caenorhabditis brenneri]